MSLILSALEYRGKNISPGAKNTEMRFFSSFVSERKVKRHFPLCALYELCGENN
jgi:hypothetical protein